MILSDIGIRQALRSGRLGITPTPLVLQPASVDLTLSESILVPANRRAGTGDLPYTLPEEGILLRPQGFILGCTEQTLSIPCDLAARFEGEIHARPHGAPNPHQRRVCGSRFSGPADPSASQPVPR